MPISFYETDKAVSEYLLFHYGEPERLLLHATAPREALDFAARCGKLHQELVPKGGRALDLGCAVGRSSYEMSAAFEKVVGIDFSHALIEAAIEMGSTGQGAVPIALEGDIVEETRIALPEAARPENAHFQQGDAMNLPQDLGAFDFVLMANLIDRLPDPAACLRSIHEYVKSGGVLAITSPYTWLEEYTPKDKWLGGYYENGQPVRAFERLKEILESNFELEATQDMPFTIREHCRKSQYSVAQASLWRRR